MTTETTVMIASVTMSSIKGKPVLFHDHNLERTRELIGRHNDGKRDNRDGDQEFLKAESPLSH